MSAADPKELAHVALEAGRIAAEIHRRHLGDLHESEWDEKGTADYVTRVDHEAEERIIEHVRRCCPGHDILAEESADLGDAEAVRARFDAADHLWVIDPLDGTTNYLHGYPAFAASVAVTEGGEIVAGAVVDGFHGTEWHAWRGGGAWRDGQPVAVSGTRRLDRSLIGTGFPFKVLDLVPEYLRQFGAVLRRTAGVRRAGAAAIDLCHVADGRFDGFWELWLAPWDIAAGTLMVREAGGIITTVDGDDDVRAAGSLVAGNPVIHEALLGLLREVRTGE
jgi:myo-inositol-1(or 4)-monophosphatase